MPKYLPAGKKFPSLETVYDESRKDSYLSYEVPRLILWQTSEFKQSAVSDETLISLRSQLAALPTRISQPKVD